MFKRLKEKKELEEKLGISPNQKLSESNDNLSEGAKSSVEDLDGDSDASHDSNADNMYKSSDNLSERPDRGRR